MREGHRGIVIGLWILTGLAFVIDALLQSNAGAGIAAPALLALAVAWTALLPHFSSVGTSPSTMLGASPVSARPVSPGPRQPLWSFLTFLGTTVALATALTIIHTGDRRSFTFVGLAAVLSLTLALAARTAVPAR